MHKIIPLIFLGLLCNASFAQENRYADIEALMLKNEYDEVISQVNTHLADENNAQLLYFLSMAYRENYQFERSLKVCKEAIEEYGELEEFKKIEARNYVSLNDYCNK